MSVGQTILSCLGVIGAVLCFGRALWLYLTPEKWDGCIYKPPGFYRNQRKKKP